MTLLVIGFGVYRVAGLIGRLFARRAEARDAAFVRTAVPLVIESVRLVLVLLFVAVVLQSFFGVNVGGVLLGFGVIGLAVGLAAKETVRNWFGAMTIFLAKPFATGDWIIFDEHFSRVERVGLNATHLRTVTGEAMIVPNMKFIDGTVVNANRREWLRRTLKLALPYGVGPDEMDRALQIVRDTLNDEEVRRDGGYDKVGRDPHVTFQEFNADHLAIWAYYWYRIPADEAGWYDYLRHNALVNRKILRAFADAGQAFAFPTQTIKLEREE